MKRIVLIMLVATATNLLIAQQRYLDEVFQNVTVTQDVNYGWNWSEFPTDNDQTGVVNGPLTLYVDSLIMDVYRPAGDTATSRPVILLSHSGSFLVPAIVAAAFQVPQGTLGSENDSCLIELCTRFAKRGYVAIAFTYRKGWNAFAPTFEEKTDGIINAVYKATHDAKSLIRFLKTNASTYGINPSKIVLGGSNSGAYVGLLAANLNLPGEISCCAKFLDNTFQPFIDTVAWGNYEGKNGTYERYDNPGPSSNFQLVLSLGGCVGDTSWINGGELPILAFHGTTDPSPFGTGIVVTGSGASVIEVSGPGHYMPIADRLGNQNVMKGGGFAPAPPSTVDGLVYEGSYPFYGQRFEPWGWYSTNPPQANPNASRAKAMAHIDTIMSYGVPRIYKVLFDPTTSVKEVIVNDVNLDIFPNPSASGVTIRLNNNESYTIAEVEVYDVSGKLVKTEEAQNPKSHNLSREGINAGIHFVNIKFDGGSSTYKRVVFE